MSAQWRLGHGAAVVRSCRYTCSTNHESVSPVISSNNKFKPNFQEKLMLRYILHQRDKNYLKWYEPCFRKCYLIWLFGLVHVPSTNMEEMWLMTYCILQRATRWWSRCIGFTFGERSYYPSLWSMVLTKVKLLFWIKSQIKSQMCFPDKS